MSCLISFRLQEEILQKEEAENNLAAFRAVSPSYCSYCISLQKTRSTAVKYIFKIEVLLWGCNMFLSDWLERCTIRELVTCSRVQKIKMGKEILNLFFSIQFVNPQIVNPVSLFIVFFKLHF